LELDIASLRSRIHGRQEAADDRIPPGEVLSLIEVTAANPAALRLLEADAPAELLGPKSRMGEVLPPAALETLVRTIEDGTTGIELAWTATTLKGRKLTALARIPAGDDGSSCMILSLIDTTARAASGSGEILSADIVQSIIDSFPSGVLVKDTARRIVLCNAIYASSLGKKPAELLGKTDSENGWSAELVSVWEGHDRAVLSGKTVSLADIPLQLGDEARFVETVLMPVRSAEGSVVGIMGMGHDVTAHRRIEAALEWERGLLDMLMEYLPDYIYFKDKDSRFIRTSNSHARALGLRDPAEAVGKTDADFYRADHALKALGDEKQALSGVPVVDIEERESYPNRPDTWALTTKMPLRDSKGDIIGTFGITHDITLRRQLEERNRQLAALVEFADDAIIGISLDSRITVWNSGAERIYGYTAEEMLGAPSYLLIPPDMVDEARHITATIVGGGQISHFETVRLRKDGTRIIVSASISAIRDAEGKVVGMASTARDVTAQKEIEAQLNRAQRLESLATLAGGIAHQFNNINTVVMGYLDLLQVDGSLSAQSTSYAAAASTALQKSVDITDRLLALTDRPDAASSGVRLDSLAQEVLKDYEARTGEGKVRLALDLRKALTIAGDESRLRFVLGSLVANALDSLLDRPSPMIGVRTGSDGRTVFFEIEDTGCGIPDSDLPRIFSPFFSAKGEWAPPHSPQARLKGVGLSLAISNMTVSEYGGRIEVRSTKDVGSTFRVVFPAAPAKA
jgi:PAS domain S-box-containing protein